RVSGAVPNVSLREVGRDGIDPGRELLGLIEAVEMPEHADKDLLHEVLRPLPVSNGPIDEVQQPGLVAVYQGAEGLGVAREVLKHQPAIVQLVQRLALEGARRHDYLAIPLEGCWHRALPVQACTSSYIRYGTNRTRRINHVTIGVATASPAQRRGGTTRPSSSGDSSLLHLEDEPGHIKDSHNGLCVSDFAVPNAGQHLRQGLWHHLDELVALARRFPRREPARQIEVDRLISEAGCGPDGGQPLQTAGGTPRLFEQLATGAR